MFSFLRDNLKSISILVLVVIICFILYKINNKKSKDSTLNSNLNLEEEINNINNINDINDINDVEIDVENDVENDIPYNSIGSKTNNIDNFMAYVDEQKFCPNIYNSMSSFWTKLPEKYSNGMLAKFCCTSCYYLVSEEIYCGENTNGLYKICSLQQSDIDNLKEYYNRKEIVDFEFPEEKLNNNLNVAVLKMKFDKMYYPIQIIKTPEQLELHEKEPTIANNLYRDTYNCEKKN